MIRAGFWLESKLSIITILRPKNVAATDFQPDVDNRITRRTMVWTAEHVAPALLRQHRPFDPAYTDTAAFRTFKGDHSHVAKNADRPPEQEAIFDPSRLTLHVIDDVDGDPA